MCSCSTKGRASFMLITLKNRPSFHAKRLLIQITSNWKSSLTRLSYSIQFYRRYNLKVRTCSMYIKAFATYSSFIKWDLYWVWPILVPSWYTCTEVFERCANTNISISAVPQTELQLICYFLGTTLHHFHLGLKMQYACLQDKVQCSSCVG